MSTSPATLFLSDDVFDLLVKQVPNEVLNGFQVEDFQATVGTSRERFAFIVEALRADGRTQGFVGLETAGYLRNALALTILALDTEFAARTGYSRDEAMAALQALTQRLTPAEVA